MIKSRSANRLEVHKGEKKKCIQYCVGGTLREKMTALKRCNCGWEDDVKMYLTKRHNICKVQ